MNHSIQPTTSAVAFLGLGNMGSPMAANLVKAGYRVRGYDPVPEALAQAQQAGVVSAPSAVAAATGADLVITMLTSGAQVLEVYADVVPVAAPGAIFLDSSTIDVADARAAAGLAVAAGHRALDAPVSGGVVGATAAGLTFMVGGDGETFSAVSEPLSAMGARAVHCGPAGSGQAAKICNNMILGVSMIAVSEAFVLAEKLGLSAQALFDVASTSSAQCWALSVNCPVPGPVPTSPANREYRGGFGSALMLKDLRLAQNAARANGVDSVLGRTAAELYAAFVEHETQPRDFSAIITSIQEGAR
jgi:3-hydroxyisobutyrate dehydrogenase